MPPRPDLPTPLLGGLTPRRFMRQHWQKKPLLVRGAIPGGIDWATPARLFDLAADDEVESRLIAREAAAWRLRSGPFVRRALPPRSRPGWTLLVQGVDLHWPQARALLDRFRFVPDARLDDLMISFASDRGGVGPHLDSYDVFLLQAQGRRRWRVGPVRQPVRWVEGAPLKLLAGFAPVDDWLLEPGDMLYLPPGWGHEGTAEGPCTTCSIGFRAPARDALGHEVLQRLLDAALDEATDPGAPPPRRAPRLYADPGQPAVCSAARLPDRLARFAREAVARLVDHPASLACALGEVLTEPKPGVRFEPSAPATSAAGPSDLVLDRRSRMLYDDAFIFLNGEAFRASGRDADAMRRLADTRTLGAAERRRLGSGARELVDRWLGAGWLQPAATEDAG